MDSFSPSANIYWGLAMCQALGMGAENAMASKFYEVVLKKTRKKGTRSCEVGGRGSSDVATSQGMPEATRSCNGDVRKDPPIEPLEGAWSCSHLNGGFLAGEQRHLCCFKSPNLWQFITAVLENEYRCSFEV